MQLNRAAYVRVHANLKHSCVVEQIFSLVFFEVVVLLVTAFACRLVMCHVYICMRTQTIC
jgi:hypothetical protein